MDIFIKELKIDNELIEKQDMPQAIKKIVIKIKKIFNIKTIKYIDDKHCLYIIPKIKRKKQIIKIIEKNNKAQVFLSNNLKKYEKELNLKRGSNSLIYFIYDILKFIFNKIDIKMEEQNLFILANEFNEKNLDVINYLLDKLKTINIVTNNVKKYNEFSEKLYEDGIVISVSNNKNKALKKANYILNLDFESKDLKKYTINENSIIINTSNEKLEMINSFQGIIINNIEIKLYKLEEMTKKECEYGLYEDFNMGDVFSSFYLNTMNFNQNIRNINSNKIKIVNIIGNKQIISIKELINVKKNIDKYLKLH